MFIIILGSSQIGATLAEELANDGHDVTVVDDNLNELRNLQQRIDIGTVYGHPAYPDILKRAGAQKADMVVAVTLNDETNMVACQVAYSLFNVPTKIARIRSPHFLIRNELFGDDNLPIDVFINPEQLITHDVVKLIEHPGTMQVVDFYHGKVVLAQVTAQAGPPLIGCTLGEISSIVGEQAVKVVALYRNDQHLPLTEQITIEAGDEVFFVCAQDQLISINQHLYPKQPSPHWIMIAGGGHVGSCLAAELSSRYKVKLIESNRARCEQLAEMLPNVTILHGDATDRDLMVNENIEKADVFCAMTSDDEDNILSSLQANHLGAKQVISLINRSNYVEILQKGAINIAIPPQQVTIGSILTHIRGHAVVKVHTLRHGEAEAMEVHIQAGLHNKLVGRKLSQLKLPRGSVVGAICRNDEIIIPLPDDTLQLDDHLIILLTERQQYVNWGKLV